MSEVGCTVSLKPSVSGRSVRNDRTRPRTSAAWYPASHEGPPYPRDAGPSAPLPRDAQCRRSRARNGADRRLTGPALREPGATAARRAADRAADAKWSVSQVPGVCTGRLSPCWSGDSRIGFVNELANTTTKASFPRKAGLSPTQGRALLLKNAGRPVVPGAAVWACPHSRESGLGNGGRGDGRANDPAVREFGGSETRPIGERTPAFALARVREGVLSWLLLSGDIRCISGPGGRRVAPKSPT
jgi:hypothetical protein